MERWGTIQKYVVVSGDFFQNVPHFRCASLDQTRGILNVVHISLADQAGDNKRLEKFQSHHLGQTALGKLQRRTGDDNRTSGVVNALSQKILSETPLLTAEHVGERAQFPLGSGHLGPAPTSGVVD